MAPPQIIILNGVGSVGKTSTAKALQAITAMPFLHVAMDAFIDMLPTKLFGDPQGLVFETVEDRGKPSVVITSGPVFERLMVGMRDAIVAMANQGNNLIVDDVMVGQGEAHDYRTRLVEYEVRFVGLHAPLEVLEAREAARGDRAIGLARWQFDRVHLGIDYDLEIDTVTTSPMENAQLIAATFGL